MRPVSSKAPLWVFLGAVLIATFGCVVLAFPHERLTSSAPLVGAVLVLVLFLVNGMIYRRQSTMTRTFAHQLVLLSGNRPAEDAEVERMQHAVVRSSWVLFLGLIPAAGLLVYQWVR